MQQVGPILLEVGVVAFKIVLENLIFPLSLIKTGGGNQSRSID